MRVAPTIVLTDEQKCVVGLYMPPPEHALVLCCDEKSQVQALDRTQPGLPLKKGRTQTMTHDDCGRPRPRLGYEVVAGAAAHPPPSAR